MNEEIQHDDLTDEELAFWLFVVYVLVIAPDCDEANQTNEDQHRFGSVGDFVGE